MSDVLKKLTGTTLAEFSIGLGANKVRFRTNSGRAEFQHAGEGWKEINLASVVIYDNASSTLAASNVNDAIDELDLKTSATTSTGLDFGGAVSINADPTKYDVAAGAATFVDAYTDPQNPTIIANTWTAKVGVTLTTLATQPVTYLYIDSSGNMVERASIDREDLRQYCLLAVAVHTNLTSISDISNIPIWRKDFQLKFSDAINAIGPTFKTGGADYLANGANQNIDREEGTFYGGGHGFHTNPKSPNIVMIGAESAISFLLMQRHPTSTIIVPASTVPTSQYDPNGDGSLVSIPTDFFTIHRIYFAPSVGITSVQYGQFAYDSLKKAVDNYDRENFEKVPELMEVPVSCALVVKSGVTDLSSSTSAKFINYGALGDADYAHIPNSARFVEAVELTDGLSYQRQEIALVLDTGVVYADIQAVGGGDLTYAFEQREYTLDCTTGAGVGGTARVALTAGSATNPQENWVYATRSGDIAVLTAATSRPSGEFAYIGRYLIPDTTTFSTDGPYLDQRYTDAKSFGGRGSVERTNEWIRTQDATYEEGMAQTVTITANVGVPDDVDYSVASGDAWQKHLQTTPSRQVSVDGIYVANHPTTSYLKLTDLADILIDANGNSLSGKRFNYVVWAAVSSTAGNFKLFLNLPLGSYGSNADVIADPDGSSVTSIPKEFRGTGFLIGRLALRHQPISGGTWTNIAQSELGLQVIDLRGQKPGNYGGAASIPASSTFDDSAFRIFNNTDNDKLFGFDASQIATGNTRIVTVPDKDITLDDAGDPRDPNAHAGSHTDGTDDIQNATTGQKGLMTATQVTNLDANTAARHTRLHSMASALDHSATSWRIFYSNGSGDVVELVNGASGTVLTSGGAAAAPAWQSVAGTGDVVGPSSATDNALARFDGTTGKLIQNSVATLSDTGVLTILTDGSAVIDLKADANTGSLTDLPYIRQYDDGVILKNIYGVVGTANLAPDGSAYVGVVNGDTLLGTFTGALCLGSVSEVYICVQSSPGADESVVNINPNASTYDKALRIYGTGIFNSLGQINFGDAEYAWIAETSDDDLGLHGDGYVQISTNDHLSIGSGNRYDLETYAPRIFIDPTLGILVSANTTTIAQYPDTAFQIKGTSGITAALYVDRYSGDLSSPVLALRKSRGTIAVPGSGVLANDYLANIEFAGNYGSGFGVGADIWVRAAESFSSGQYGTKLDIRNCATGSSTLISRLQIESDGTLNVAGTSNYENLVDSDDDLPNWKAVTDRTLDKADIVFEAYNATGGTNIDGTEATLGLSNTKLSDTSFSLATNEVTVSATGVFEIEVSVDVEGVTDQTGGARCTILMLLQKDTGGGYATVTGGARKLYLRETTQNGRSFETTESLSSGDKLRVRVQRTNGTTVAKTIAESNILRIKRVR